MRKRISASKQQEYDIRHQLSPAEQLKWDRKQAAKKSADAYRRRREQLLERHIRGHKLLDAVHAMEDKYGSITATPMDSAELEAARAIVDAEVAPVMPAISHEQAMYYRVYKAIGSQVKAAKSLGISRQRMQRTIIAVESNGGLKS